MKTGTETINAWFLYDSGPGHPFLNMALDEQLLKIEHDLPILRFYTWQPPALSLGYFQHFRAMSSHPVIKRTGAVITRRMTGGDAILHIHELTFSLVGAEGRPPFDGTVESSYHRIHLALAEGFKTLGISASLREAAHATPGPAEDPEGRCFYRVTSYDLVAGGAKLVGSAQRRTQGRVLHHGSIPLAANPLTPGASDLSGLAGRTIPCPEAARTVRRGFEKCFAIRFTEWQPPRSVLEASADLAGSKYGAADWVRRR
jgi:lipoate-protein ligase A